VNPSTELGLPAPALVGVVSAPEAVARVAAGEPSARAFDLLEVRVDLFDAPTFDACADACARVEATGTPVLVTIRLAAQGGRWARPDASACRCIARRRASPRGSTSRARAPSRATSRAGPRRRAQGRRLAPRLRAHAAARRARERRRERAGRRRRPRQGRDARRDRRPTATSCSLSSRGIRPGRASRHGTGSSEYASTCRPAARASPTPTSTPRRHPASSPSPRWTGSCAPPLRATPHAE